MRLTMFILAALIIGSLIGDPADASCGQILRLNASNCYQNGKVDLSWDTAIEQGCTFAGFKIEKKCGNVWQVVQGLWPSEEYTYPGPCCETIIFRVSVVCLDCPAGDPSEVAPWPCRCPVTPE